MHRPSRLLGGEDADADCATFDGAGVGECGDGVGGDQNWSVPANSPVQRLTDATERQTMAYSTNGATSRVIALGFVKQLGVKAKPAATGGPPATYTMTMTGQIDIGWAVVPFGLAELQAGKIRVVARGPQVPPPRNPTIPGEGPKAHPPHGTQD